MAALTELQPLAEQGIPAAQFELGGMSESGLGVEKDAVEAVQWYRLAADQGYSAAQNSLGVMYGKGSGVVRDLVAAHMWFNIASANGEEDGGKGRDLAEKAMTRDQIAEATGRAKVCMESGYKTCD